MSGKKKMGELERRISQTEHVLYDYYGKEALKADLKIFEEMWSEFPSIKELENLQEAIRLEGLERYDEKPENIYSMIKSLETITKEIKIRKKWSGQ